MDTLVFEEVEPNPRSSTVDRGARIARDEKVDLVIGLGGGSAMDTAKGIVLASTGNESIWHYIDSRIHVTSFVPSIIQVPTIAGTGSEVNKPINRFHCGQSWLLSSCFHRGKNN